MEEAAGEEAPIGCRRRRGRHRALHAAAAGGLRPGLPSADTGQTQCCSGGLQGCPKMHVGEPQAEDSRVRGGNECHESAGVPGLWHRGRGWAASLEVGTVREKQGLQPGCARSYEQYFEQTGGGTSPLCMKAELLSSLGCQPQG